MAKVTLTEDQSKKATTTIKAGEGIKEILYFPKVPKDLNNIPDDEESEGYVEEIWALQGNMLELFIAETEKYDEAAKKLAEAQEKMASATTKTAIDEAQKELEEAQETMRTTLVKGFGKKEDEVLTPVPQGTGKNLIECIGFVNKRMYYISVQDLVKVESAKKGSKNFRFSSEADGLFASMKEYATDSNKGDADEKLKNKFWSYQAKINKEWKFLNKRREGQIKLKRLERFVTDPAIREFLKATDTCQIIDTTAKFLNETANFSYQQKEQKLKEIKGYLNLEDDKFSHYHWGKVILGVQEIWAKEDPGFFDEFRLENEEIPLDEAARKKIAAELDKKELPDVTFDASGGAQFMRYSANSGGVVDLDFANGKVSASYNGDAKLSIAEAGAEFNRYFPNNNGIKFEFRVPVRKECFVSNIIDDGENDAPPPMFAHNSSFVLPAAIIDVGIQMQGIAVNKNNKSKTEQFIQVAGHADTTGSNDYNEIIGYRRAKATHALFTDDKAQWQEYFKRGIWKDEERDFLFLSLYMMNAHPKDFEKRFLDMKMNDQDTFDHIILRELQWACATYNYPISKVKSSSLRSQLEKTLITDGPAKSNTILSKVFTMIKDDDASLINDYQTQLKKLLLKKVNGIDEEDFNLFYADTEAHPVLTFGEENLKVEKQGRVVANRRVTLRTWEVTVENQNDEVDINLGKGRIKVHGQVSCFVGATVALSAGVEFNTYKGAAQLVGKRKVKDVVTSYNKDKELKTDEKLGPGNATAKATAFAGAKAEASLSAALEWYNPEKAAAGFGLLASVGGMVTGTAGAGIEGEFRIGYDRVSKTFQVKMKAQATWGLGGGGAWSLSIGVQQLYDFVVLVYHKLEENDFNFVDIFENEKDNLGNRTESEIDVYQLYIAWVAELWKQKEYFKAGNALLVGAAAKTAFSFFDDVNKLILKYNTYENNKEETQNIIYNVLENSKMMRYTPPKVKGHMLYMLTRYKSSGFGEFINDLAALDDNVTAEDAAVTLIKTIRYAREWKEVMEHMAVKTNDGKSYDPYNKNTIDSYIYKGDTIRVQHSVHFLRNELLNDYDDWAKVRQHLQGMEDWDKAWNPYII